MFTRLCLLFSFVIAIPVASFAFSNNEILSKLKLPPGFAISIYAQGIKDARQMSVAKDSTVYVTSRTGGKVYALIPNQQKTAAKQIITVAKNLNYPNGVAYHNGDLYIAEIHRIIKLKNIKKQMGKSFDYTVINDSFPNRKWHGYKVIKFSPDNWLYIAVGMPCNTCNYRKTQPMFGTIMKLKPDGSHLQIYAKGLRNSMGFDWHPKTGVLWLSDNGQDMLGDNYPPDEINRAAVANLDFGFPYYIGNNQLAPNYTAPSNINPVKPAYLLPAHVAPLGISFYTGNSFPANFHNQLFIAEHGSWNRSKKIGYQVNVATINGGKITKMTPFISGWLQGQKVYGRPVDIINYNNGLLISDDYNGLIYRVYRNNSPTHE